jgi:hypothetical protein
VDAGKKWAQILNAAARIVIEDALPATLTGRRAAYLISLRSPSPVDAGLETIIAVCNYCKGNIRSKRLTG